ncbi:hypothetical protein KP509_13G035200 [Ceratopteris richardii]|uniref:Bidirectional sugar transporter SWEET n=2 Tax=Ceratopteris richardii TaxID=49495 RepID=A0A8T2TEL0_CERRI|nr:hypothetical protein KP509_13G035200 [Ceratopteris richardii]
MGAGGGGDGRDVREIAQATLGILGNIASCVFFLSSAPTIVRLVKSKTSGGLSGDLYALKLFNCMLWCFYGTPYVHPHDFWVVLTNSLGSLFSLMYIVAYLWVATSKEKVSLVSKLCTILLSMAILILLLVFLSKNQGQRIFVVGILCALVSSGMHLTLLSQCRMAIQSKDKQYLHPNASLAAFLKGAIWTAYGVVDLDIFILIPNGVGVIIGILQVILVIFLIHTETLSSTTSNLHRKDMKMETDLDDLKIICEEGGQDLSQNIGLTNATSSNVSRVSSLLVISRQGSIVVPIDMVDVND